MSSPNTPVQPTVAPGEPAFIRRLPAGVEYTHIKTIFMDLPSPLTTLLWSTSSQDDRLLAAFKGRTIRVIDRALRREAKTQRDGHEISAIRHQLAQLALHEANGTSSPHPERRISVTHVVPQLFDEAHRPPGPSVQHVRITVTSSETRRPKTRAANALTVLEERVIVSEPAAWDSTIPFIDPEAVDAAIFELLHKHFPRLMGLRVGARWRSNYSPEGWRLVPSTLFRSCSNTSDRSIRSGGIATPGGPARGNTLRG